VYVCCLDRASRRSGRRSTGATPLHNQRLHWDRLELWSSSLQLLCHPSPYAPFLVPAGVHLLPPPSRHVPARSGPDTRYWRSCRRYWAAHAVGSWRCGPGGARAAGPSGWTTPWEREYKHVVQMSYPCHVSEHGTAGLNPGPSRDQLFARR
jgi:hypothetical protein